MKPMTRCSVFSRIKKIILYDINPNVAKGVKFSASRPKVAAQSCLLQNLGNEGLYDLFRLCFLDGDPEPSLLYPDGLQLSCPFFDAHLIILGFKSAET